MMWNEQTQQDARRLVESVNQRQWNAIVYAFDQLSRPATEADKVKERVRQEQAQKEREARQAEFEQRKSDFQEMKKKINKGLEIPERYEWSYEEIHPMFNYAIHPMAGHEGILDLANAMFELGFKRGMSCQQSKTAKKADELLKKSRHPSRMKAVNEAVEALEKALS